MTRRVLLCTIGDSPQVATETVWALKNRRIPPWIPDAIEIVTTSFGLPSVRAGLQAPSGPMAKLLGCISPPVTVHVPCRSGETFTLLPIKSPGDWDAGTDSAVVGVPDDALMDVNTVDDSATMGNAILRVVARIVADSDSVLHLSLAGGRKTMSAHALMALSLIGRPRDEASHVLIGADFEGNREFWHPDQEDGSIHRKSDRNTSQAPSLDPRDATASLFLVPTPAPLMRYEVDKAGAKAVESLDLARLIKQINAANLMTRQPHVRLDTRTNTIEAGGLFPRLSPKLFALYRLAAAARANHWQGTGPDGVGVGHAGWLSYEQISAQDIGDGKLGAARPIALEFLKYLREAVSAKGGDSEDDRTIADWQGSFILKPKLHMSKDAVQKNLSPNLNNLDGELRAEFGSAAASILGIEARRNPGRFGLMLPPDRIEIV